MQEAVIDRASAGSAEIAPAQVTPAGIGPAAQPGGAGRWLSTRWPLIVGLLALILPTIATLARLSWSTEAGTHGPIVLATGLWLVWRERHLIDMGRRQPLFPAILPILFALPAYAIGRITNIMTVECAALYVILVTLAWLQLGPAVLRRFWFPCVYFLFLITPPENWLFVATRPIKMAISELAVDVLSWAGYSVGSTGVMIQIDGFQLLVATACSGINSLIGICALSLFYVYLRHGSAPRYALLLTALLLPVAILSNFVRIILLILITHYFGEAVGQGIAHDATGTGMFMLSMLLLIALDGVLHPVYTRFLARRA